MSVAPITLATSSQHGEPETHSAWSDLAALHFAEAPEASTLPSPEMPDVPSDLSTATTRELRILANQLYRVLDADFPPFGAREDYEAVVELLAHREARAAERTESENLREKFRDNPVSSRFELFHDGTMVGYVKYDMRAGRIRLLETVVGPAYRQSGLEPVLVRQALLSAHRRRLAPIPYCRHVQAFLTEHPQFRALIPVG
ncbi:N-acetyltransferase [Arthrobacter sp. NamB2]|uniref:GNAT family N-acetyltransferase n=1 Tax=Arthrobacter sp. NamB2 TaxID=2576035 RepID=UPI0010C97BB8|nr:N-acetyltransferase [Arthrobacter sp. NamB2]TKV26104.1 N-acetyltransferase [Arthrobacter sp. NamB2]